MPTQQAPRPPQGQAAQKRQQRREREEIVGKVLEFEREKMHGTSQRHFAEQENLPRATVQGWLKQKNSIAASRQEVAFFESPEGIQVLRRIVVAAHLVMSLLGACV